MFIYKLLDRQPCPRENGERLSYGMGKPGTKIGKLVNWQIAKLTNCSIYGSDTYEEKESYR